MDSKVLVTHRVRTTSMWKSTPSSEALTFLPYLVAQPPSTLAVSMTRFNSFAEYRPTSVLALWCGVLPNSS